MLRYLVLDLDGTLAPIGRPASEKTIALLHGFEAQNVKLVLCSGKPTFYLTGFARQAGFRDPVLIGENGAQIVWGIDLPPKKTRSFPVLPEQKAFLEQLKHEISQALGDRVWFQPNLTALTPFLFDENGFEVVDEILASHKERIASCSIKVYKQCDCFDILPKGIDKGAGLSAFLSEEGAKAEEVVSIGDGINDFAMFERSGFSIGVSKSEENRKKLQQKASVVFQTAEEALIYVSFRKEPT